MAEVRSSGAGIIIVTGGEPLMHNLDALVEAIREGGSRAHLETSGTYPLSGAWDWITLSPKPHRPSSRLMLESCNELKMVISSPDDLDWAESIKAQAINTYHAYLQPEWSKRDAVTPFIISHAQKNKGWRVGLQTHKFLGIR
jgi:7-carboxy-7-deazaguanine synthase